MTKFIQRLSNPQNDSDIVLRASFYGWLANVAGLVVFAGSADSSWTAFMWVVLAPAAAVTTLIFKIETSMLRRFGHTNSLFVIERPPGRFGRILSDLTILTGLVLSVFCGTIQAGLEPPMGLALLFVALIFTVLPTVAGYIIYNGVWGDHRSKRPLV